ncbi:MAG: alanine racemase [Acidobacteriaceae bacterium]
MTPTRPIWAEISRQKLIHNFRLLRQSAGAEAETVAVVKANAYGHGLEACARAMAENGARWFAVTCVEEAVTLRAVCAEQRILALSGVWPGEAEAVLEHGLTPSVWDVRHLELLEDAARQRGFSAGTVAVHLEIDTGMSRQGVQPENLEPLLARLGEGSPLRVEAVMTHFHSPDDGEATAGQMRQFATAVDTIVRSGIRPEFLSAGSSADVLSQTTGAVTDLARRIGARRMVRTGLSLYGYSPQRASTPGTPGYPPHSGIGAELDPVLAWKARISGLREIEAGTRAGYGGTFTARRRTRLALLPAGYADGLSRLLSNQGWVLVRGQRAPVAGRVSMDQTMVDVTEIAGAAVGDEAVLIGEQGAERVTAADLAELTGTIPYEMLCAIAPRVARVMVE